MSDDHPSEKTKPFRWPWPESRSTKLEIRNKDMISQNKPNSLRLAAGPYGVLRGRTHSTAIRTCPELVEWGMFMLKTCTLIQIYVNFLQIFTIFYFFGDLFGCESKKQSQFASYCVVRDAYCENEFAKQSQSTPKGVDCWPEVWRMCYEPSFVISSAHTVLSFFGGAGSLLLIFQLEIRRRRVTISVWKICPILDHLPPRTGVWWMRPKTAK